MGVPPALVVDGLECQFGADPVLAGVSFTLGARDGVAVMGTNGAGKSTLLRVIAGLQRPSAGSVVVHGRDVTSMSASQRAGAGIVLVQGGRGVFPDLTVADNLEVQACSRGHRAHRSAERREAVFDLFPVLADRLRQRAGLLSGGEQQQLALAKAVLVEPTLLCIDELSLGLAPKLVDELLEVVAGLHAGGLPVVVVEQSLERAIRACERAIFLERGAVVFDGPTAELQSRPDLTRAVFFNRTTAR